MKNTKLLKIFLSAFAVTSLSACGGLLQGGNQNSGEHEHKHEFKLVSQSEGTCTQEGIKLFECNICGEQKEEKIRKLDHDFDDGTVREESTCETPGTIVYTCKMCLKQKTTNMAPLGHLYGELQIIDAATCENPGYGTKRCQRCGVEVGEYTAALGHNYVVVSSSSETGATCTTSGKVTKKCTRCAKSMVSDSAPLGHSFPNDASGELIPGVDGAIEMHKVTCERNDFVRYFWSAGDTSEYTLTELVNKEYPLSSEPPIAPRIIQTDNNGYKYWGRPIGNACILSENGETNEYAEPIYHPSVEGDFFEFNVNFNEDLEDFNLVAELLPTPFTYDVFVNTGSEIEDWTPGLVYNDEGYVERVGPCRYVIEIDGERVDINDETPYEQQILPSTSNNKIGWFKFPGLYNFAKGKHTIKIIKAGGWNHTFFRFGVEKTIIPHTHDWKNAWSFDEENMSPVTISTCPGCDNVRYKLGINDLDGVLNESQRKITRNGNVARYAFNNPEKKQEVEIYIRIAVDVVTNLENGTGFYWGKNGGSSLQPLGDKTNISFKFNDKELTCPRESYQEMGITGTTESDSVELYLGIADLASTNTFTITRNDSYGPIFFGFTFILR